MSVRRSTVQRLALLACVVTASAAGAQTRLTLEQAQARALEASHRLAESRAHEAAAIAGVAAREAAQRPLLGLSAGHTRTNHVTEFTVPGPTGPRVLYPDVPDNYRSRLDLQWPIYSGGRMDALERAARAEAGAAAADVATAQADLRLEVARAFWAVVTARAATGVLDRSVERTDAHLSAARNRFNNGLIPPNEVSSVEAQFARATLLLTEAQNQDDVASADLARLVNAAPGEAILPDASLELLPPAGAAAAELESFVEQARAFRSERRAMARRIEAADERQVAAAAGRLPTISLGAGVDYARPNPRIFPRVDRWEESWDVGVNVNWSLWDGGRTAADAAQASALATAARERLAEFDSVLAVDVRQRALEIDSGRAAVAAADEGVRAAAEARRVVGERYTAGVITQTEVLDAEVALLQAELDRTRALAALRFAEARLTRGIGR